MIYFDFTCAYSYRAWRWFERMNIDGAGLNLDWQPFVLKEVNRSEDDFSLLAGPKITSVAVLALAVAEALKETDMAERFRGEVFHSMHERVERPDRDEIIRIATDVGLDEDAFWREETAWLKAVRESHEKARSTLGVFGTPTLVPQNSGALYVKLEDVPRPDDHHLLGTLVSLATDHPEVAELKRPVAPE